MQTKRLSLAEALEGIEDFRQENSVEHKLTDIVIIAILGTLCGADGYAQIYQYAKSKMEWLRGFLELPNGLPSAYTIRRVLMNINPTHFHEAFIDWVALISKQISGIIAIDGKTARRTKGLKDGKKALHVVSAFALENSLILGQRATEEKSNEITAIPELLKMLAIQGCIVTIDAAGTQKAIAEQIIEQDADYVLALKENQETLFADIKLYMEEEVLTQPKQELKQKLEYHCTIDNDHGRLEKREYYVCDDVDWLEQKREWPELRGFGVCVSTVTAPKRVLVEAGGKKKYEIRDITTISHNYAIYSVEDMSAEQFARCKRGHWGIENTLHWSLDMAFREDESRARVDFSAENLNTIRHFAFNLLKCDTSLKAGMNTKRLKCGWDDAFLFNVLNPHVGI
jgi:predicted transposase YbfD/YdcC